MKEMFFFFVAFVVPSRKPVPRLTEVRVGLHAGPVSGPPVPPVRGLQRGVAQRTVVGGCAVGGEPSGDLPE